MKPTAEQAQAISQRGELLVSASAGSGKTAVMIERLVSLVLGGVSVKEVLAVTFTKKAAAQMRERLRLALIARINEGHEELAVQLEELPLAEISTIHAFCGRLVRANFFLAGVDASFRIISPDDAEGRALRNNALREVIDEAYEKREPAFEKLLAVYFRRKRDRLKNIIFNLHASVRGLADYRGALARFGDRSLFEDACGFLAEDYRERMRFLCEGIDDRGAFFAENNTRALKVGMDVTDACNALLEGKDLFEMAERAANHPSITMMPRMTKATGEEYAALRFLSGASKEIKAIYKELRELAPRGEERALCLDAAERARTLASLVLAFDEKYTAAKREAGVLDYDDLEQCALTVLQNEGARAQALERYRYIFVDEYQDVNPIQERILALVSGKEVFLVGDGKQAIYGFRGSRSQYFEAKRRSLAESGGAVALTENFRSAPAILDAVNRVFSPIIAGYEEMRGGARYKKDGREYAGEVIFHRVEKKERPRRERGVYSVIGAVTEEKTDALAESVADLIEREILSGKTWFDADAGEEKKVTFGDIAVLTRKNTGDMERVVQALAKRDIPVVTSAKVNVCDFFEARLLLDWFSYLDNAMQDIPLASAMLSAVGGFTESELARIRLAADPAVYTFRECVQKYARGEDELAGRIRAFFAMCSDLRAKACVKTAAEMAGLLLSMGLQAQIAAKREGSLRLARVRRLVFESENCGSIHAFLARLRVMDYQVDYAEGGGENAVKVLTMHAAKGLEYPVVLLAGLDAPFHGADRDEVMWTERFLAAPKSFDFGHNVLKENLLRSASAVCQEKEELLGERNLLYVAMTRARYRLHLFFEDKEPALSPAYARKFSDFFDFSAFTPLFSEEDETVSPVVRGTLAGAADPVLTSAVLASYHRPYRHAEALFLPVKSSATQLMREEETPAYMEAHPANTAHTAEEGLAYHAFLEHVRFGEDAERELSRMGEEGVLSAEQIALLDAKKLRAILAMPCLAGLENKRLYREQTFLVRLPACEIMETEATDEIVFQGAIDLLIEDGNGYSIVDYKFSGRDDETVRKTYRTQIGLYKKAVARATGADEETIRVRILNIAQCREIEM